MLPSSLRNWFGTTIDRLVCQGKFEEFQSRLNVRTNLTFLFNVFAVHQLNSLTVLLIKHDFHLQLCFTFETLINHRLYFLLRFRAVKKLASATLLHDLRSRESCQLTKSVGTINDRIHRRYLRISEDEVAI